MLTGLSKEAEPEYIVVAHEAAKKPMFTTRTAV